MSSYLINDQFRFRALTPEGPVSGTGIIAKIFQVGQTHERHVRQADGNECMVFEAISPIEVLALEAA